MINEGAQQGVAALKPAAVPVGHQESALVHVRNVGGTSGVCFQDILYTYCQDILYRLGYKFPPEKEGEMPWKEVGVKDQRISLVARALGGKETMKDLCQEYGISGRLGICG